MPTWKIKSYWCYFKIGEILKPNEPAHIHIEVARGEIEFWLTGPNEGKIKKIEGSITSAEKSQTAEIIKEKKSFFLQEWEKLKAKI